MKKFCLIVAEIDFVPGEGLKNAQIAITSDWKLTDEQVQAFFVFLKESGIEDTQG